MEGGASKSVLALKEEVFVDGIGEKSESLSIMTEGAIVAEGAFGKTWACVWCLELQRDVLVWGCGGCVEAGRMGDCKVSSGDVLYCTVQYNQKCKELLSPISGQAALPPTSALRVSDAPSADQPQQPQQPLQSTVRTTQAPVLLEG